MTLRRNLVVTLGILLLQAAAIAGPAEAAQKRDASDRAAAGRSRPVLRAVEEKDEHERDSATERRRWQRQWYGESDRDWSPAYRKFMNMAAAKERARWGHQLPRATDTKVLNPDGTVTAERSFGSAATSTQLAVSGSTWTNIGPTKADVEKNGGTTLTNSDGGRPVAIAPHPTDANILYVAMSGGGVWKTTTALAATPAWAPITDSLGSLSCGYLAIDPADGNTLYLGLGDAFDGTGIGLVKTTDGGLTWSAPVYLGNATVINDIAISTANRASRVARPTAPPCWPRPTRASIVRPTRARTGRWSRWRPGRPSPPTLGGSPRPAARAGC